MIDADTLLKVVGMVAAARLFGLAMRHKPWRRVRRLWEA